MKIKEAINWLELKPRFKDKTDLSKMSNALKMLDNPQNNFKAIHITGTNGKGSVAHFISSALKEEMNVGLFTSPYVTRFNERLQINDLEIEDEKLLKYILWAKEFDEDYFQSHNDRFSFFELLTLIAFKYFSDEKVDYAIIEVGIGGRLDATNVINADINIITSLGVDHIEQLGNKKEDILKEKLGIVKETKTLFTAVSEYDHIINSDLESKKGRVYYVKEDEFNIVSSYPLKVEYKGVIYESGLQGIYQVKNLVLAVKVLKYLNVKETSILKGVKETLNPGRFEVIKNNPFVVLDGAHNLEAIIKLLESLKKIFKDKQIKVLYASMIDKPYEKMVKKLKEEVDELNLTSLQFPRALNNFNESIFKGLNVYDTPVEGYKNIEKNLKDDEVLVITGSMYLVSEIRNYILNKK